MVNAAETHILHSSQHLNEDMSLENVIYSTKTDRQLTSETSYAVAATDHADIIETDAKKYAKINHQ